jgi:DNA-directed RNA polymerase specialized sigma24 family protein
MKEQGPGCQPELLLDEWLRETDVNRARQQLELLVELHAEPLVRRIVGFKLATYGESSGGGLPRADVDDVSQNALYHLLARLDRLKYGEGCTVLRDFTAYAAVTAYNACNEYFRSRRPAWLSLSMKVRYLATHSPKFALWDTAEAREACGLATDRGREPLADAGMLSRACEAMRRRVDASRLTTAELMDHLLSAAGRPILFELLVDMAAELSGLQEDRVQQFNEDSSQRSTPAELRERTAAADTQLIHRSYIARVWKEIRDLPVEHRKALLLNLNDSAGGDIRLLDSLGIASVRQIAEALEMEALAFAELWKDLPLDDARIGLLLGISRQDVANRRSAARKRLARRMQEAEREI